MTDIFQEHSMISHHKRISSCSLSPKLFSNAKKRRKESYILVHVSYEKKQGEKKVHVHVPVIMYVKN